MSHRSFFPRLLVTALAGAALVAGLSACAPLVVGGAAVASGMVATDRRTSGAQLDDQGIELRAAARIRDIATDTTNITAISFNRQVLLVGTVGTDAEKRRAEEAVRTVPNVRGVFNEVVIGSALGIAQRSNDTFITGKVKASLLDAKDVFGTSTKVVTEGGVVYLMGLVTRSEMERATEVARSVSGVTKVVRAFELITDQQAAQGQVDTGSALPAPAVDAAPSNGSRVPLPPMAPLPAPAAAPVVTPVR